MPKVLIVEDDLSIADLLQEALEGDGYDVTGIARTVEEAVKQGKHDRPHFAVIDVHLARGGLGTDVPPSLRLTMNIGVLFSTGNDSNRLTGLPGDAVMTKPYRLTDVSRGLKIVGEIVASGRTELTFPRNFRLLDPAA